MRTSLPPAASIAELLATDRQATLDPDTVPKEFQAKGLNQVFAGRHQELIRLSHVFHGAGGVDHAARGEARPYGALLYGAPGSGKSALKDYWRDLWRSQAHAVIRIAPEAFRNREALRNALVNSDEWREARWLRSLGKTAGDAIAHIQEHGSGATGALVQQHTGVDDGGALFEMVSAMLRLGDKNPVAVEECMDALATSFTNGFTIAVDEAEDLDVFLNDLGARELMKLIGDPSLRPSGSGLGGLLLAGLPDTVRTVEQFKLTRFHYIRMGPLRPETALEIIREALTSGDIPTDGTNLLDWRWTRTLARDFHQWPHHTRCAAVAVEHLRENIECRCRETGSDAHETDFDDLLEQARTIAAKGATQLYRARWKVGNDEASEESVRETIALSRMNDGVMHERQLNALLEAQRGEGIIQDPGKARKGLLHSGLIEPIIPDAAEEPEPGLDLVGPYLRVGIPSMAVHIEMNEQLEPDMDRVRTAEAALPAAHRRKLSAMVRIEDAQRARYQTDAANWERNEWPPAQIVDEFVPGLNPPGAPSGS